MSATEMPRPGAAHERLRALVGRWVGDETLHPSPWDPQGGTAIGRVDNRSALAGFTVVQDYRQERGGAVVYEAHGVFTWDPAASQVVLHWFDSFAGRHERFVGDFDGDALTLTSTHGRARATWTFAGDRYTYRMEVSPDGERWFCASEGTYARGE